MRYRHIPLDEIRAENPERAAAIARRYDDPNRPAADLRACRTANPDLIGFPAWLDSPGVTESLATYLVDAESG